MISKYVLLMIAMFVMSESQAQLNAGLLTGLWKIDGKEQFEEWKQFANSDLYGISFNVVGDITRTLETLSIRQIGDQVIYNATVPDQNEGKTISFALNKNLKDKLSFENMKHDFPKKIQYTKLTDTRIFVEVLGENEKGFSYYMTLQLRE